MSPDIPYRLLLSHATISFIQRSVPSKSTTWHKSCPTMTNHFLVMSVDEIFSCRTANVKQPLVSSRCNLSLSLCNNFSPLLERGVTSSLPLWFSHRTRVCHQNSCALQIFIGSVLIEQIQFLKQVLISKLSYFVRFTPRKASQYISVDSWMFSPFTFSASSNSIGCESIRRYSSVVNLLPRCKHREDTHRRICN